MRRIVKAKIPVLVAALLSGLFFTTVPAVAQQTFPGSRQLVIATTDNTPISIERLLFAAFQRMRHNVDFVCPIVREGYMTANDGTNDGVIAGYPGLDSVYTNLRKVPVPLENINVQVFAREGSELSINSWAELDGLNVGILENRVYILERLPRNVRITAKDTNMAVLEGVANGEYDVAVLSERDHEMLAGELRVIHAGRVDYLTDYLYLNKSREPLIPQIAAALEAMVADGTANRILSALPFPEINPKKTVLHIISGSAEMEREDKFSAALKANFELDASIEWKTINLDTMSFSRDRQRLNRIAQLLRMDCVSKNIVAVIVSGDLALTFLMEYYYLCFRNVPVLFYGVGSQYYEVVGEHKNHFTGIVDDLEAGQMVEAALSIFPNTKNIYVVNDYGTEGTRYRDTIEAQLGPFTDSHNIEYNINTDTDSVLEHIRGLPQDSLVFIGSYFIDANNQYYTPGEMKRLLERDCGVPVLSLYSTELAYNAIGGKCLDYRAYGEVIAGMLRELLDGAQVRNMPAIGSAPYNRWVFDQIQIDRFNIRTKALPSGTHIINKIPSVWESNPKFAVTYLLLFVAGLLVVALILVMFLRGRGEKKRLVMKQAEVEAANRAKSAFLANMNHEMRTPMNAIVGLTDLMLEEEDVSGKVKETLQKINAAGTTLMGIINDVLDISKIESGKQELKLAEYDVAGFINDIITLNIIRIGEKPVTFKLDINDNLPQTLFGDDLRVKQILNNLLSNAFKYTQEGTVTLQMRSGELSAVKGASTPHSLSVWVIFIISDTGIGIRNEDMAKLFSDFNQVDTRANRKIEGTGLGLSITKKIVELMDGEITVESEYGKGTTFRVRIRQGFITDATIGRETAENLRSFRYLDKKKQAQGKIERADLSYARVLVADDFPMNLDVAAGMLRKYKMQVDCVLSGREAVDLIAAGEPVYDAVFMDHMMPEMDGVEATALIRALGTEYAKTIPVIALTANAVSGSEQMFLANGFNAFLPKPFNVANLDSVICRWVRK